MLKPLIAATVFAAASLPFIATPPAGADPCDTQNGPTAHAECEWVLGQAPAMRAAPTPPPNGAGPMPPVTNNPGLCALTTVCPP